MNSPGGNKNKKKKIKEGRKRNRREQKERRKEKRERETERRKAGRKEGRMGNIWFQTCQDPSTLLIEPLLQAFWSFGGPNTEIFPWHFLKGAETGDEHSADDFPLREGGVRLRKGSKSQGELFSRSQT